MSCARCYVTAASDEGLRLDALLSERGLFPSRSAGVRAIEEGRVLVDGQPASKKTKVRLGQAVVYEVEAAADAGPLRGEAIPLDVRFEDDHVLVLSKQAGLVCHPTDDHRDGTLVNALIHHCGADHLCNVQGEQDRLGIVHRLDMDTSGLMLTAKTDWAGRALMDAIAERTVDRHYVALVHGIIGPDTGMIDAPIARHPKERLRRCVRDCEGAREAITTFSVLRRFEAQGRDNGYTLVDCKLFTGRTHQIRVHMEYIKHPLVGDPMYQAHKPKGGEKVDLGLNRQFLHSSTLRFDHPVTGEPMEFTDTLPADLQSSLDALAPRQS